VHIHVGSESESARYVLTAPDTERARDLASHVTEPSFWIKWPAAPGETAPVMPAGWRLIEPQFFMGARLQPTTPLLPHGYHLTVGDEGDALEARVTTDSGTLAARGRIGLSTLAVPDQIATHPEHRRRGLGQAIMGALSNAALDRGRSDAVLLASDQGRHLYSTLGWGVLTPFWATVSSPRDP
jgi:GNAT superfamily N-acetyltransferase